MVGFVKSIFVFNMVMRKFKKNDCTNRHVVFIGERTFVLKSNVKSKINLEVYLTYNVLFLWKIFYGYTSLRDYLMTASVAKAARCCSSP